jgi:hypothetical protein
LTWKDDNKTAAARDLLYSVGLLVALVDGYYRKANNNDDATMLVLIAYVDVLPARPVVPFSIFSSKSTVVIPGIMRRLPWHFLVLNAGVLWNVRA